MNLNIMPDSKKYQWKDSFVFAIWQSREGESRVPLYYDTGKSKKKFLGIIANSATVPEELVIITSQITELLGVVIYKDKQQIELCIGNDFQNSYKIVITSENYITIGKLLEDL